MVFSATDLNGVNSAWGPAGIGHGMPHCVNSEQQDRICLGKHQGEEVLQGREPIQR
jgi:hypothetical protein